MKQRTPPRFARRLLRLLPLGRRRVEIEADLLELFDTRVGEHGPRYAARRYWGDVISLSKRECLDWSEWRSWRWNTGEIVQDLGYAVRLSRRSPGVVGITTAGLALAIAVSASVFSLVNAIAFRGTGVDDPATAVSVFRQYQDGLGSSWPYAEFLRLREAGSGATFEATLTESTAFSAVAGDDEPATVAASFVTGGYFPVLNPRAARGRTITPGDAAPGAPPVAVLSHAMWVRRFGRDPAIVGRQVWLNGATFTVIGVAAPGFTASRQAAPELWAPISTYHLALGGPAFGHSTTTGVSVVGRLAGSGSRAQAEATSSAVAAGLGSHDSQGAPLTGVRLAGYGESITGSEFSQMVLVFTIVTIVIGLVLLLACANVSNLLLASASTRAREVSVRLALGASAGRIVRQLLTESVALGLAGGVAGLLLTMWLMPILIRVVRAPVSIDFTPGLSLYLFVAATSLLAGLGAGLAPARHAIHERLGTTLKGSSAQAGAPADASRLRSGLVGIQAAASIMLVVLAALLVRATVRATHVDVGFDASQLLSVSAAFGSGTPDAAARRAYWDTALDRVRALPGVESATIAEQSPFGSGNRVMTFRRNGRYTIYFNDTRADYFATIGLRVLRGRTYTEGEAAAGAPVAVISEAIASDFFPAEDPIGQSLERITGESGPVIIGIVSNAITARVRELRSPSIYQPLAPAKAGTIIVRTAAPPEAMIRTVRTALHPLDPRVRLTIAPLSEGLRGQLEEPRVLASLAISLAATAMALALVGIYGVTTFVVGQRTHEIGVRMALGASARDVTGLLLGDSLRPIALGLGAGVLGAMICSRVFAGVLYGVSALDPIAFIAATSLLLLAATAAVIVPARRAAAIDPATVLRQL